jgi:DNA-binding transcriptional ArsR family regulator
VFAALGDRTRLRLVARLSSGEPASIARLTRGSRLTRQAVTKHLHVLERAGLVRCTQHGRERLFALNPGPLEDAKIYLDRIAAAWDQALMRLKNFVEE